MSKHTEKRICRPKSIPIPKPKPQAPVPVKICDRVRLHEPVRIHGDVEVRGRVKTSISGQTVIAIVQNSGQSVVTSVSGDIVSVVNASGTCLCANISGDVVLISGQSVTTSVSGNIVQISGQQVEISGQSVTISGDIVQIENVSGQTVSIVNVPTNPILDYKVFPALGTDALDSHVYVATGNFRLSAIEASASGAMKVEVETGTSGDLTTKIVGFTTPSNLIAQLRFYEELILTSGQIIEVILTNRETQALDVYSTIMGFNI